MARPTKLGLDYFPFDVDFFVDEKISAIEGEFGSLGVLTVIKLLCLIYRNGYFIRWSDVVLYGLLRQIPELKDKEDVLRQIITRLVEWDFFDRRLFETEGVLTSRGIQDRFYEVYRNRARKRQRGAGVLKHWLNPAEMGGIGEVMACRNPAGTLPEPENLVKDDEKVSENGTFRREISDETDETAGSGEVMACRNPAETRQSKVKESKVKESNVVVDLVIPDAREEKTTTTAEGSNSEQNDVVAPAPGEPDARTPQNSREVAPIFESWRYSDSEYSPEFLALLDEIAAKFNLLDARMYARQLESLLREVHRPGVVDGITVVRDGLKKLDTAEAVKKNFVTMSVTRFLRYEIFIKLINGDYDTVYKKKRGRAEPEDTTSFDELQKQGYYN